jgi:hypothetical protein
MSREIMDVLADILDWSTKLNRAGFPGELLRDNRDRVYCDADND